MHRSRSKTDVFRDLQRQISELQQQINVLNSRDLSVDWIAIGSTGAPAFQNGWGNYTGGYANASFKKDSAGNVHLKGLINAGTVGAAAFTLPVGFRSLERKLFVVIAAGAAARMDILATGEVILLTGTNDYVQLDLLSFPAEQ